MHKFSYWLASSLAVLAAMLASFSAYAQNQKPAMVPVTTTVTVLGPNNTAPPAVTKRDVVVFSGKTRLNVTGWVPSEGQRSAGLQLAILIDNAVHSMILGPQLNDIRQFIESQSKNTAIGVFYAENGTVEQASPFDTNHDAVAKKLRLSFGRVGGESPSIYLSLQDLVKKWPAGQGRREVLMISSGIDQLNPGLIDPYFDSAVESVQKAGVVVHTIYAGSNRFGESFRGGNSQSKLVELTQDTGGQGYFEGLGSPVSFGPYLNQLDMVLRNQYLLTVEMPRSNKKKGELRPVKISAEERNVVISAPSRVFVPGA